MKKAGKLDALESSLTTLQLSIRRCAEDVKSLKNGFQSIHSRLRYMEYKTIDLEAISRQNNLLFHGLSENNVNGDYENSEELVRDFIVTMLGMGSGYSLEILSAYRLGNSRKYDHGRGAFGIRPVLVVFKDYRDTEVIIDLARVLKGTKFAISRDYPRELNDARKKLLPLMKQARRERKPAQIMYPAKLVVNGHITQDEFPGWDEIVGREAGSNGFESHQTYTDYNGNKEIHIDGLSNGNNKTESERHDFACVEPGWTLVVDSHKPMRKWKSCEVLSTTNKNKKQDKRSNYTVWKKRGNAVANRYYCDEHF